MLLNFITPSKDMKMHYKLSASALPQRVVYVWQVRSLSKLQNKIMDECLVAKDALIIAKRNRI
jgi:hypothetical protein